jgi:hypothetical protein
VVVFGGCGEGFGFAFLVVGRQSSQSSYTKLTLGFEGGWYIMGSRV